MDRGLATRCGCGSAVADTDVMISYGRADIPYVVRLVTFLEDHGIPVWWDGELPVGQTWNTVLRGHLERCAALIVVMSTDSEQSAWVDREIRWAEDHGRQILPLRLDGTYLFRLTDRQAEDVTGGVAGPGGPHHAHRTPSRRRRLWSAVAVTLLAAALLTVCVAGPGGLWPHRDGTAGSPRPPATSASPEGRPAPTPTCAARPYLTGILPRSDKPFRIDIHPACTATPAGQIQWVVSSLDDVGTPPKVNYYFEATGHVGVDTGWVTTVNRTGRTRRYYIYQMSLAERDRLATLEQRQGYLLAADLVHCVELAGPYVSDP